MPAGLVPSTLSVWSRAAIIVARREYVLSLQATAVPRRRRIPQGLVLTRTPHCRTLFDLGHRWHTPFFTTIVIPNLDLIVSYIINYCDVIRINN